MSLPIRRLTSSPAVFRATLSMSKSKLQGTHRFHDHCVNQQPAMTGVAENLPQLLPAGYTIELNRRGSSEPTQSAIHASRPPGLS